MPTYLCINNVDSSKVETKGVSMLQVGGIEALVSTIYNAGEREEITEPAVS